MRRFKSVEMNLLFSLFFAFVIVRIPQNIGIYLWKLSTKKGLRKSRKPSLLLTKSTLYLFGSAFLVTRAGIEPALPPWKGGVLTAWPTGQMNSGNFLLSRAVSRQVSSTLRSLTSVFGMGTGGSSLLSSPDFSFFWGYTLKTKQCISLDSISNSYALTFLVKPSVY